MISKITDSPVWVRALPFLLFAGVTALQDSFGATGRYWVYAAKTLMGAGLTWLVWPLARELRWNFSREAVLVGVGVFVLWIGLDSFYPKIDELFVRFGWSQPKPKIIWNPFETFGQNGGLAWLLVSVRILGSSLVVPPLEELFFRSFLYRYLQKADFLTVSWRFAAWPFLATALSFGLEHQEWLAGILCGFAYQGLVCWKGRLGDAIAAHALTNFLLGCWVVWRGAWGFW